MKKVQTIIQQCLKTYPELTLNLKVQFKLNLVTIVRFAAVLQSGAHSRPDIKNRKDRF